MMAVHCQRWNFLGALLGWAALGGCGQPPAVLSNSALTPEDTLYKPLLTSSEQARAIGAMRSFASGQTPVNPPAPAPQGMRWSDVRPAVESACRDIEATVVKGVKEDGGRQLRFAIRTVESWPGELLVRRLEGPRVYEAEASIGRFPDDPKRVERAQKLLEALEKHMKRLGRMRWFNDEHGA